LKQSVRVKAEKMTVRKLLKNEMRFFFFIVVVVNRKREQTEYYNLRKYFSKKYLLFH